MPVEQMLPMLMGSSGGQSGGGGGIGQSTANMASGIFSGIVGLGQRRKAKKLLANLQRPEYMIPNEVLQNQKMAQQAANEGLPSQQYNQAMQNIQRQQNRAIVAAGDRRGGLMALPGLQQQANDALLGLDIKNAQTRMANQQRLYGVNSQLAGYRDKSYMINKLQPYQQNYNYGMNLLASGNQNFYSGIDKLLGGGGQFMDAAMKQGGGSGGKTKQKANYITASQRYVPDNTYMDITNMPDSTIG